MDWSLIDLSRISYHGKFKIFLFLGIRSRIGLVMLYSTSVGLFCTQYCGMKKMAEVVCVFFFRMFVAKYLIGYYFETDKILFTHCLEQVIFSYPNWTTSGTLSFIDLTVPDPSFLLPTLTAICFTSSSMVRLSIQMSKFFLLVRK